MSDKRKDPFYKGEPTPKYLKHGPTDDRRCTDVFCVLMFILFWVGAGMIGVYSYKNVDDIMSITYVYDQNGVACKGDFPALYFIANEGTYNLTNTVCIDNCPVDESSAINCEANYADCASVNKYASTLYLNRFCMPTDSSAGTFINETVLGASSFMMRSAADLQKTWWVLCIVGLVALVCGFIYLLLLKYFAGLIIWTVIILFLASLTGIGSLCLGMSLGMDLNALVPAFMEGTTTSTYGAFAAVFLIMAFVCLVITCCFRGKINLSIAVLKASTDFVEQEAQILLIPPIFFLFSLAFYVLWVIGAVLIVETNDLTGGTKSPFPEISWSSKSLFMMGYYIFALIWSHAFNAALSQFIIASAVCLWYFKKGKAHLGKSPVWKSVGRAFLHWGSIALGSFLIGLLEFIKLIISFIHSRVKKEPSAEAVGAGFCLACCNCFINCFENSLKFLSRHAYIQIAMTGDGFFKATEDAFHLLLRNAARFGLINGISWIFLFFGKVFIATASTMLGYYYITTSSDFAGKLYSPITPTIFFALISYLIAKIIMNVYGISADTIIHCFAMDEEIHDGAAQHAPQELREFVDEHHHKKLLTNQY